LFSKNQSRLLLAFKSSKNCKLSLESIVLFFDSIESWL
jgi:hypothetical protein